MKTTLTEMKNTLDGIYNKLGEIQDGISNLEDKIIEKRKIPYDSTSVVTVRETERQNAGWDLLFNGYRVYLCKTKKVLEMDGDNNCIII